MKFTAICTSISEHEAIDHSKPPADGKYVVVPAENVSFVMHESDDVVSVNREAFELRSIKGGTFEAGRAYTFTVEELASPDEGS